MSRFIAIFIFLLAVLFPLELFQPVQSYIIAPFTATIAHSSVWLMRLFDHSVVAQQNVIIDALHGGGIEIVAGCSGVEAMLILFCAVIAFPASFKHKLVGIAFGFFAIQLLNMVRIISLYYLHKWNEAWFEWLHLYLWQALIVLDTLFFWLIWLRWLGRKKVATAQ